MSYRKEYLEQLKEYIGKTIVIKGMNLESDPNSELTIERYFGKTGVVERVDDAGQLWGTWGGVAIIPDEDEWAFLEKGTVLKDYTWEKNEDGSGCLRNQSGKRVLSFDSMSREFKIEGERWEEMPEGSNKFEEMEKIYANRVLDKTEQPTDFLPEKEAHDNQKDEEKVLNESELLNPVSSDLFDNYDYDGDVEE